MQKDIIDLGNRSLGQMGGRAPASSCSLCALCYRLSCSLSPRICFSAKATGCWILWRPPILGRRWTKSPSCSRLSWWNLGNLGEIFFGRSILIGKYDSFHVVAEVDALAVQVDGQIGLIENLGKSYLHSFLFLVTAEDVGLAFPLEEELFNWSLIDHQQWERLNKAIVTLSDSWL